VTHISSKSWGRNKSLAGRTERKRDRKMKGKIP
jgi:hypothetical protein